MFLEVGRRDKVSNKKLSQIKKHGFSLGVSLKSLKSPLKRNAKTLFAPLALRFKGGFADFSEKPNAKPAFFYFGHFFLFLKLSPGSQLHKHRFGGFWTPRWVVDGVGQVGLY